MHEYEAAVLKALKSTKHASIDEIVEDTHLGRDAVLWAIDNLAKEGMLDIIREEKEQAALTDEGKAYAKSGLPEEGLIQKLANAGQIYIKDLDPTQRSIGLQWAKAKGFIEIGGGSIKLTQVGEKALGKETVEHAVLEGIARGDVQHLQKQHADIVLELIKRKLVTIKRNNAITQVKITSKGHAQDIFDVRKDEIDRITKKIIVNREWEGKEFKRYDVRVGVEEAHAAKSHPLRDTINQIKDAYAKMGFREVSGPIVESSFWVQDALMIPQDHPARDAQDTFYIEDPQNIDISDNMLLNKVAKEHEKAWNSEWKEELAQKAMLRSHSTSVTARFLYSLKDIASYELPIKIFSVGRVFRNESLDYRHLADFYQGDGMIIGEHLTLANLFDTLTTFYSLLGMRTRFMPTYFPFVEPGVEIQAFYSKRNEWLEMGGAGVLRHEIINAAGKRFSVLAWGCGIERIVLMKNPHIKSVTELYNNGIGWMRKR